MMIDDEVRKFESGFAQVADGTPSARSQTGEEYEVVKTELHTTVASAVRAWRVKALAYAKGRGNYLYWRTRPEMTVHGRGYTVWSRFLVSSRLVA